MPSTQWVQRTQRPLSTYGWFCFLVRSWPSSSPDQLWTGRETRLRQKAEQQKCCLFRHSIWHQSPLVPVSEVPRAGPLVQSVYTGSGTLITRRLMECPPRGSALPDAPHARPGSLKLNTGSLKRQGGTLHPNRRLLNMSTLMEVTIPGDTGPVPRINQQLGLRPTDQICFAHVSFLILYC